MLFVCLLAGFWLLQSVIYQIAPAAVLLSSLWLLALAAAIVLAALAIWRRAWLGLLIVLPVILISIGRLNPLVLMTQRDDQADLNAITLNAAARTALTASNIASLREHAADIALLQETFVLYEHPDRIESLTDLYPYQRVQPSEQRYRGNMTLSAYPILEIEGFEPDSFYTRVVVDVGGQPLAVYNVSLAAPFADQGAGGFIGLLTEYDTTERDEQIETLLSRLDSETLPHIVGGDFNMHETDPMYNVIATRMIDSFREAGGGTGVTWPASALSGLPEFVPPLLRLDYLWHSDGICTVSADVLPATGSDHLPVRAAFAWC